MWHYSSVTDNIPVLDTPQTTEELSQTPEALHAKHTHTLSPHPHLADADSRAWGAAPGPRKEQACPHSHLYSPP